MTSSVQGGKESKRFLATSSAMLDVCGWLNQTYHDAVRLLTAIPPITDDRAVSGRLKSWALWRDAWGGGLSRPPRQALYCTLYCAAGPCTASSCSSPGRKPPGRRSCTRSSCLQVRLLTVSHPRQPAMCDEASAVYGERQCCSGGTATTCKSIKGGLWAATGRQRAASLGDHRVAVFSSASMKRSCRCTMRCFTCNNHTHESACTHMQGRRSPSFPGTMAWPLPCWRPKVPQARLCSWRLQSWSCQTLLPCR